MSLISSGRLPWDMSTARSRYGMLLTLWTWSWTFKFQHNIYVKCEYFMNQKKIRIMKCMEFCGGINGDCTASLKKYN
jgi:hypothetical protein